MPSGAFLGIDFGKKVVGLAYFHPEQDPSPMAYSRIVYQSDKQVISELKTIIKKESIKNIVLGLPLYPDGNKSLMSDRVLSFAKLLKDEIQQVLLFAQNEAYSSSEAKERMENSVKYNYKTDFKKIDELSACIILERFIK